MLTTGKKRFVLIVVMIIGALMFAPIPSRSMWWREAMNSGHVVLFAVVAWLLFYGLRQYLEWSSRWWLYVAILLCGLLFGLLIEYLQSFVQREASWGDVLENFLGLLAGIAMLEWWQLRKMRAPWWRQVSALVLFTGALVAGFFSFSLLSLHYLERRQAFPVVMDFDAPWASSFVGLRHARKLSVDNAFITVQLTKGRYPGVNILEVEPDWSGFSRLVLDVFLPQSSDASVVLRVDDRWHNQQYGDRFNQLFVIHHGENRLTVPLTRIEAAPKGRKMDMENINEIKIFAPYVDDSMVIGIGDIYLE